MKNFKEDGRFFSFTNSSEDQKNFPSLIPNFPDIILCGNGYLFYTLGVLD
jgi:hypothetical protein